MKQNINFTLLGLLIVVIIAMIAMTFYYNSKYTELAGEYQESLNIKNNLSDELAASQKRILEKESELSEKIKNLNLSSSEVMRFEKINKNLTAEIEAMNFDNIYKTLNELKTETDLIGNVTARNELNNKINVLDQEIVDLENQVFSMQVIAKTGTE